MDPPRSYHTRSPYTYMAVRDQGSLRSSLTSQLKRMDSFEEDLLGIHFLLEIKSEIEDLLNLVRAKGYVCGAHSKTKIAVIS